MTLRPTLALIITLGFALGSCGGGGSDESQPIGTPAPAPTPAPALSPTPTPTPMPSPTPPAGLAYKPNVSDTWQWQLRETINIGYPVRVYDIDLVNAPQATIDTLHAQGRRVICYFSAGSSEDLRDDYKRFNPSDKGRVLQGFDGERWLDIRSENVKIIMRDRIALAASKRCDAIEPDNVDGYSNNTGFPLTANDQLSFNLFLASEGHKLGLAVALKNDLDQIPQLVGSFDFAVNEQCHEIGECDKVKPFIAAGKPVFNAEYDSRYVNNTNSARDQLCATAQAANIRTLVLPLELEDKFRYSCD